MGEKTTLQAPLSRKWYLFPLLIFILGPLISLYLIISLFTASKYNVLFTIPGLTQVNILHPGEYTLWIENKNPMNEEEVKRNLETMTLTVIDNQTHRAATIVPKPGWGNTTRSGISHFSLGTLEFNHSGIYQVSSTSNNPSITYKVYLRQPSLFTVIKKLAASIVLTLLSSITSILFAIIILIKRMNTRDAMEQQPQNQPTTSTTPPHQAITWATFCHLSGFAGYLFPLANIIAPLLIWSFKRHEFAYLDEQGKEAINFQISITIYYIISAILIFIVIGLILLPLVAAFHIIAMIIAAIETANGKPFKYPLTIHFLK